MDSVPTVEVGFVNRTRREARPVRIVMEPGKALCGPTKFPVAYPSVKAGERLLRVKGEWMIERAIQRRAR